jgi:hypothetical protein
MFVLPGHRHTINAADEFPFSDEAELLMFPSVLIWQLFYFH